MPLALLAMVGVGDNSAMWASLFTRAAMDTVEPGMKTSWVVLPYFSKKPASLATHRGAVLPVSLAVVKFMSAAGADTGAIDSSDKKITMARYFIRCLCYISAAGNQPLYLIKPRKYSICSASVPRRALPQADF